MKRLLAAVVLLATATFASAQTSSTWTFDGDRAFFQNPFPINEHIWAEGVGPVNDTLSFVGIANGTYDVTLWFEASAFNLVWLTVNGVNATVTHLDHNYYSFASIDTQADTPFEMRVFGWFAGQPGEEGHYVGKLFAVPAVPEPSTYAMLLAGLAAMGFVAHRRRTN